MGDFKKREFRREGPGRSFGPSRESKAVCADCGKECTVPFKPREGQPVYCRDCYAKRKKF